MMDKSRSDELIRAKDELQTVVAKVKALNEVNTQLLNDSVEYIKKAFEFVTGKNKVNKGYGRTGSMESSVNVARNLVNTRV